MKRRIGTGAATGFSLASVILLLDAVVGYRNVLSLQENEQAVTHTRTVLARLANVLSTLKDAEAGQRGFFLTGDARYLKPYDAALDTIPRELDPLQDLTADNPRQQGRLNEMRQRVAAWLDQLGQNIDLHKAKGLDADRQAALLDQSKDEMDGIRALGDDLKREEEDLLARRAGQSGQSFVLAQAAQVGGAALSLGLLGLAYGLVRRELTARARAEAGLVQARDELERRVTERTAELGAANEALRRSNQELEQFASVASHDLQEPLRKIQAFGDRLHKHAADVLDEQGRDYLSRMRTAAVRMRTLINDLLALSRVTMQARPFQELHISEVARETVADLEGLLQHTQGRVEVGELPILEADPVQMHELLLNLIGNGLKFHRPGEPPVVRVEGRLVGEGRPRCELTVRDNGIGFDASHREHIFEVFRRLHGRSEYEGTGIGLAICRKIVQRHGGTITASSAPGQGATFVVTLPVRQFREEPSRPQAPGTARTQLAGATVEPPDVGNGE
jgi:signal transduction histidine kinase